MKLSEILMSSRELYERIVLPVCRKYDLTYMEFTVLMFLANNPECDTAAQIVKKRQLTKSHVSISVRSLQRRAYVECSQTDGDKRVIRLAVGEAALPAIEDGRAAQEQFVQALLTGFSGDEMQIMQRNFQRMEKNIADWQNQKKDRT
jgi:DNA-binding MarR family transcriptional regulator